IHVGITEYPIRDLGLPALITLPFAIAGRLGVLALMCVIGAALAAPLYLACRDFGITQRPRFPPGARPFGTAARLRRRGRAASLASLAGAPACVGVLPWLSPRPWLIAVGIG